MNCKNSFYKGIGRKNKDYKLIKVEKYYMDN
jgi:hypothetical protein